MSDDEVSRIVEKAAKHALGKKLVDRVFAEPGMDAEGHNAVRITIVVKPDAVDKIDGDLLLDNLLEIHDALRERGEERTPIVGYATEAELAESDDSES